MKLLRKSPLLIAFLVIIFSANSSVFAKDEWLRVRSKNFNLIGNASEKDIKKAATKLEQFRETFRQVFKTTNLTSSIPTNVIVFKSNSYYKTFKPKRADGKIDNFVAGFFQPGEDVNYITLSMDGDEADVFGTVFHEYVHFILNTNFTSSDIPPWFNEGLAEYYQTFQIVDDQKVKLGLPQSEHLAFLQSNELIPLKTLFGISSYGLLQMEPRTRNLFYAESWALIHYLIQSGKTDGLGKFLSSLGKGADAEIAFRNAFQTDYAEMEKELRKYVRKATYQYNQLTFSQKLIFETNMVVTPMGEGETNAYLGDLLYHTDRAADAEPYLLKALAVLPDSATANMAMGMVRFQENKFDEARAYLEKVVSQESKNHYAYYRYAYVLARSKAEEGGSEAITAESALKIATLLKKAIDLDPNFLPSYDLLAFSSLVSGKGVEDAAATVLKALKYKPDDTSMSLRLSELYVRMNKIEEAGVIAGKVMLTADDPQLKARAESIMRYVDQRKDLDKQRSEAMAKFVAAGGDPSAIAEAGKELSAEEQAKVDQLWDNRSISGNIKKLEDGSIRVVGHLEKITCVGSKITYTINTETEKFLLTSPDFQSLELVTYGESGGEVGCDADLKDSKAIFTYKAGTAKNSKARGELFSIDFVPNYFKLMSGDEMAAFDAANSQHVREKKSSLASGGLKDIMLKPTAGEKRVLGTIETMECGSSGVLKVAVDDKTLRLAISAGNPMQIRSYAGDPRSMNFNCGMKALSQPIVVIYKDLADAKSKTDGTLVSIEVVPNDFKLD